MGMGFAVGRLNGDHRPALGDANRSVVAFLPLAAMCATSFIADGDCRSL